MGAGRELYLGLMSRWSPSTSSNICLSSCWRHSRTPGYFPAPEDNKHNAWYVKTSIKGAADGPLKGRKIAAKDNVMVAGVPMMNGCSILEGYVPEVDATVIARLLDAGAEIVGKVHCESTASGGSYTGAKGPVHNPVTVTGGRVVGGQRRSGGIGEADMALGGDQGGPSACLVLVWNLRHEVTHGLVPYTGIMPIEISWITRPMTLTVKDNALMLA
jgi:amidase